MPTNEQTLLNFEDINHRVLNLENKISVESDFRVLNLENTAPKDLDPSTIPTLIKSPIRLKQMKEDTSPVYKVQRFDVPIISNGLIFNIGFFESFLGVLPERPIPGSKRGHTWSSLERPPSDFYLVGGKIVNISEGRWQVYFKNYIPKMGDGEDDKRFIEDVLEGLVHFSLVSHTDIILSEDPDTGETIRTVGLSKRGERNDAVGYNLGGMKQVTNVEDTIQKSNTGVSERDSRKVEESYMATKEEVVTQVFNLLDAGRLSLDELAKICKFSDKIVNAEHLKGLEVLKAFNSLGVEDPVVEYNKVVEQAKVDDVAIAESFLDTHFGASVRNAQGVEKNVKREFAASRLAGVKREDRSTAAEVVKNSDVFKALSTIATPKEDSSSTLDTAVVNSGEAAPVSGTFVKGATMRMEY